ncbi:hypothetical protein ACOAKC_08500 [Hathewaya histolytica]|uniref:hypothetical protein n=1 Tax=Hathewaya histolytica TaxID=1498 RepID=UPI003B67FD2C
MSTLALNRSCKLQMPSSFVDVDVDEMEYVDGGGFYISNGTLKSVVLACGLNPITATLTGLGYWKVVSILTAKFSLLTAKLGSVGGVVGAGLGFVLGGLTAKAVVTSVVDALWSGKGIELGFTWRPTIQVK